MIDRKRRPGRARITPELVEEIERLFADETSVNTIVKRYGIGWETAASIRDGLHRHQQERADYLRCPECGGMVILPCRACGLRQSL